MLLQALVPCAGVTLRSVAINRGVSLSGTARAEAIRLRFELQSDAPAGILDAVLEATERYCVIYQTLRQGDDLSTHHPDVDAVLRFSTSPPLT